LVGLEIFISKHFPTQAIPLVNTLLGRLLRYFTRVGSGEA